MRAIGIMDCNSFYASAEALFDLSADWKPVIVLSNNDGCIIALNKEAKRLGLKMGIPVFQLKPYLDKLGVKVYSSNYALYDSISDMVTYTLSTLVPEYEKYSIDESFFHIYGKDDFDFMKKGYDIFNRILDWNGINVGVGIAKTKTLAKVANKVAKRGMGVCVLIDEDNIRMILHDFDVSDLWGIGENYSKFLKSNGINTAGQLLKKPDKWIQKHMTKVGLRLVWELRGIPCYSLKKNPDLKKNVGNAKSFGHDVTDYQTIYEALSTFTARAAEQLRKEGSYARFITVFLQTNPFKKDLPQYCPVKTIPIKIATNSTIELCRYMKTALNMIYKSGYAYKKAGIFLTELTQSIQDNLFYKYDDVTQSIAMSAMDKVNAKYGRDTLKLCAQGTDRDWRMRQEKLTQRYTTCWDEIMIIKAK